MLEPFSGLSHRPNASSAVCAATGPPARMSPSRPTAAAVASFAIASLPPRRLRASPPSHRTAARARQRPAAAVRLRPFKPPTAGSGVRGWMDPRDKPEDDSDNRVSIRSAIGSERDLVAALELQNLAGLVGGGDLEAQSLDDLAHLRHLLGVALGEAAGTQPQRVLEADAHVAAHGGGLRGDGHLVAPGA